MVKDLEGVIKLPFLSFFSLFFLPFRYNMPFLCPHVTCQLSCVRLCQALSSLNPSGSSSLTPIHNRPNNCQALSGSVQPHSRPLAFLSQIPFMPLSLKKHVTLLRYQPFPFSCLCNSLTGRHTLPIVLIVPPSHSPSHSHSKAHSCLPSFTLLTHRSYSCSSFLTCSCTLILVAYLAFSLHSTLSFATLTLRCTLPSTLSSHSPSTHSLLSHHPVRVTLLHDTHVLSLTHRRINTT